MAFRRSCLTLSRRLISLGLKRNLAGSARRCTTAVFSNQPKSGNEVPRLALLELECNCIQGVFIKTTDPGG